MAGRRASIATWSCLTGALACARHGLLSGWRSTGCRCGRCWPRMRTMPLYRYGATGLEAVGRTSLAAEQIRERQDLQRVLRQRIDVLGDDLLVVAEEYGLFEDSRRRVDLLALDRKGTLVVIELKRTDDGGHMELQSLRYAAMVSTMTIEHLVNTYAGANGVDVQEARAAIAGWVEEPFDELPNQVRIILVSADFSTEITSTVIWLNDTYNTDISCYRIVPYRLGAEILLDLQQIIPLPEAEDAFRRQYPSRSPGHLWYDLGISEGDTTWVIPRFGGRHTEQILDGLATVAPPHTTLRWSASDTAPTDDEDS